MRRKKNSVSPLQSASQKSIDTHIQMAFIESSFKEKEFGQYTGIVCPVSNKTEVDEALKCLIEDSQDYYTRDIRAI